eukprot:12417324-Karenia_brevis.AAC.1
MGAARTRNTMLWEPCLEPHVFVNNTISRGGLQEPSYLTFIRGVFGATQQHALPTEPDQIDHTDTQTLPTASIMIPPVSVVPLVDMVL